MLIELRHLHLTAHSTSLCNASKYRNISLIQSSVIFQPLSLNSKKRTIDNGLNVSKITFKLEMTVQATKFIKQFHMTMCLSQCMSNNVRLFRYLMVWTKNTQRKWITTDLSLNCTSTRSYNFFFHWNCL